MCKLFSYYEHYKGVAAGVNIEPGTIPEYSFLKKRDDEEQAKCFRLYANELGINIELSYFIGVDWISEGTQAIYVEPKLNNDSDQVDYLQMLFSALKHPQVAHHTDQLFEIKFDKQFIEIEQQQDKLTPLLVVQFLTVVKNIVRKGLKKSYYKVDKNLFAKIKGKVLVGPSIKSNLLKNKPLHTVCRYDEFGLNGLENRLLKKTLIFIQHYLPTLKNIHSEKYTTETFNYINPAFETVSAEVDLNDIKRTKTNPFYKEYAEAIHLAKLILKRFGYNITNTQPQEKIKTPPFWIDMSKLFELYVLGLLKDRFHNDVLYHFSSYWNELDYLLCRPDYKMVIDAKYKIRYQDQNGFKNEDIRQVSGYARLKSVYEALGKNQNEVIDCLIIYPDQTNGSENLFDVNLKENEISQFVNCFKHGVKLPLLQ